MQLTSLESKALAALFTESSMNGHDFGVMEDVVWEGDRKQLGGLVTQLKAKGFITSIAEPHKVNGDEVVTQFVLAKFVTSKEGY